MEGIGWFWLIFVIVILIFGLWFGYSYNKDSTFYKKIIFKENNTTTQAVNKTNTTTAPEPFDEPLFTNTQGNITIQDNPECANIDDVIGEKIGFIDLRLLKAGCIDFNGVWVINDFEVSCTFTTPSVNCNSSEIQPIKDACNFNYTCNQTRIACTC